MRTNKKVHFIIVIIASLLAGLTADSSARLNPRQASLRGANVMTVDVICSRYVKDTDLNEQDIGEKIEIQLQQAGIKIKPKQFWQTVPGQCRLKVLVKVYKPQDLDTFIYNLKIYFVQTVILERIPETKIEAVTWEISWLAHGSKNRLAEAIPENLKLMIDNFIRDYNLANPKGGVSSGNIVSTTIQKEQISSPNAARYMYVSSKNSQVFHRPNCRSAKRIKPENLVGYNSKEEVIQAGKRPCKVCKP